MKPTCGPLPWETTSFQPCSTMSMSGGTVRLTVSYCCGMESCSASVTSALPPKATIAVLTGQVRS